MALRLIDSKGARKRSKRSKALALALVALSSTAMAQDVVTEVGSGAEAAAPKDASPFSGVASLNLRSSTTSRSDYDYRIFLAPSVNGEYEFKDLFTVGLSVSGQKDLNNEQRSTLTGTTLSLSRSVELAEGLGLGVDVSYGAPVSKDLIKYANHKGTLGGSAGLSYRFTGVLAGLAINGGLSYERYLHQYDYANGGQILTKYAWSQNYGFSYTWDKLTFSTSFTNISAWDFMGERENDSYLWVETLQYKFNGIWSAHIGHISNGNSFDYNGAQNNVQFYDKRRSQVYVGTSYRF